VKVNEVSIYINLYKTILQKFHQTSKTLQQEELNIGVCGDLYQSLAVYLTDMREHFDRFEKTVKDILLDVDYKELKTRTKRRKTR